MLGASEYEHETTILTVADVDTSREFFIVASTAVEGEQGPFVVNLMCEAPGAEGLHGPSTTLP